MAVATGSLLNPSLIANFNARPRITQTSGGTSGGISGLRGLGILADSLAGIRESEMEQEKMDRERQQQADLSSGIQKALDMAGGFNSNEIKFITGEDIDGISAPERDPIVARQSQKREDVSLISRLGPALTQVGAESGNAALLQLGGTFTQIGQADRRTALDEATNMRANLQTMFAMLPEDNTAEENLEIVQTLDLGSSLGIPQNSLSTVEDMRALMVLKDTFMQKNKKVSGQVTATDVNGQKILYTTFSDGSVNSMPVGDPAPTLQENPQAFARSAANVFAFAGVGPADVADMSTEELSRAFVRGSIASGATVNAQMSLLFSLPSFKKMLTEAMVTDEDSVDDAGRVPDTGPSPETAQAEIDAVTFPDFPGAPETPSVLDRLAGKILPFSKSDFATDVGKDTAETLNQRLTTLDVTFDNVEDVNRMLKLVQERYKATNDPKIKQDMKAFDTKIRELFEENRKSGEGS